MRASKSIQIDGTLLVNKGGNLALLSDGPLTINGKIKPNITASSLEAATKANGQHIAQQVTVAVSWFGFGSDVTITGDVTYASPGVAWVTSKSNGTLTIKGNSITQLGIDGTNNNRDGGDSASIDIGTDAAFQVIKSTFPDCAPGRPAKVIIAGDLQTGRGGYGYNDGFGKLQGATQVYLGGKGGNTGNISISASDTIDLTAAYLAAGHGGKGGETGQCYHPSEFDGQNNGDPGRDVVHTSGTGGKGGDVILTSTSSNIIANKGIPGVGGDGGYVIASAGNGGPGGPGGNTLISVGEIGQSGTAPNPPLGKPWNGFVTLCDGGNGFDDCRTPPGSGTNGGNGSSLKIPGYTTNDMKIIEPVVNGGSGGSGDPPGSGGGPGSINLIPGASGTDGNPCPAKTIQPGTYTATPVNDGCGVGEFTLIVADTKITIPKLGANSNVTFTFSPDRTSATSDSSNLILLGSGGDSIKLTFTIGTNGTRVTLTGSNPNGGSCMTGGNAK